MSEATNMGVGQYRVTEEEKEIKRLTDRYDRLNIVASEIAEALANIVPDRNCSCHINPPCGQCVEFGQAYEAIESYKNLNKPKKYQPTCQKSSLQ